MHRKRFAERLERRKHGRGGEARGRRVEHARRAEEARVAGKHDVVEAEARRHGARVLAARAAEGDERVAARVDRVADAERLDRERHARVGDLEERLQRGLGGDAAFGRDHRECGFGGRAVDGDRALARHESAREEVDVGDGERAAAAVARGAGVGAGAFGPDLEDLVAHAADRAAARRDAVDRDARRRDGHAVQARFAAKRGLAMRDARDIGARAAHVEADGAVDPVARCNGAHRARAARRT